MRLRFARALAGRSAFDILLPGYVAACLVLGGASAAGHVANAMLQASGALLLAWSALKLMRDHKLAGTRDLLVFALCTVAMVAIELVPLPAWLQAVLPGRGFVTSGRALLGLPVIGGPISLDPNASIGAALSLLPAFAVAAATLLASGDGRKATAWVILVLAIAEIGLGALQVSTGASTPYDLYEVTNRGSAIGLFANSNHMATLLLVTLPFTAALAGRGRSRGRSRASRWRGAFMAAPFLVLCLGILLNGSVAGLGLLVPAVGASVIVYLRAIGRPLPGWIALAIAAVVLCVLVLLMVGPLRSMLLDRTLSVNDPTTRRTLAGVTLRAARAFFPIGSGLGTFQPIYRRFEDASTVSTTFINHAHCDYLEILLELGAIGVAAVVAFLIWYLRRLAAAWREPGENGALARAGSIAVAIVLLHSTVDYPARTAAILAIVAFALGLLASLVPPRGSSRAPAGSARHASVDQF